jgi:hypothetical protein
MVVKMIVAGIIHVLIEMAVGTVWMMSTTPKRMDKR